MLKAIAYYWACLTLPQFVYGATTSPEISIKGSRLYKPNGDQFFVKGVSYYLDDDNYTRDRLVDTKQCEIDAELMANMGVNTIRVYEVEAYRFHDGCMEAFDKRGIYVWLDLDSSSSMMRYYDPVWTRAMYEDWASKIDEFAKYSNLLAFGIGGDTIDVDDWYGRAAPYVRAAAKDMKAFRDGRGYRQIPIAYNQYDSSDLKNTVVDYLTCGDYTDSIDMFGLGLYQACGSDVSELFDEFANPEIPIVVSEIYCTFEGKVRNFTEVETVLTGTWSETNNTALVEYPDNGHTGKPVLLPDYTRLQSIFSSARPKSTTAAEYTPTASAPACPTQDEYYHWGVDANLPLPTISGLPSVTRAGPGGIPKQTDGSGDETKGGSGAFGGLGLGGLIGVIVGGSAGIAILAALGWLILRRRRRAQYAQGTGAMMVGVGAGSGSDNNNNSKNNGGDYKPGQGYAPTNVYLGPQEMSGSGEHPARHELYSGEYSAMQLAGAVAYAAGSLKPRDMGTMSGPQTPSELSPGAGDGRRGSYQMQSVSDYDGTTPWSSPRIPVQTFEMEGDSGIVTHTPAAADSAGDQAPKQQLEPPTLTHQPPSEQK
ncbi:glycoside hydrolase family 72 protein [Apiospora hydei]|uniref:1,3-beta-glucanosyltransferase n=1 Tax=Apiospora hydei TaxID=1337664 RepID=A0ABR1VIS1_9PEZI